MGEADRATVIWCLIDVNFKISIFPDDTANFYEFMQHDPPYPMNMKVDALDESHFLCRDRLCEPAAIRHSRDQRACARIRSPARFL